MARPRHSADEIASTREALLDAAQSLFERGGADEMSFRAIAERGGCSHTKLYSYFDSKADLIDALRLRAYRILFDQLSAAAQADANPLVSLRALAGAYLRFGLERPRMYGLLYSDQGQMREDESPLHEAKVAALGVCREVIGAAADTGLIDLTVDPLTAAHIFWAGAHGLVELELGGFLVVGRTIDDVSTDLVAVLTHGLGADPT